LGALVTAKILNICAFAVCSVLFVPQTFARDGADRRPPRRAAAAMDARLASLRAASQADFARLKSAQPEARAHWLGGVQAGPEWITDLALPTAKAPTLEKRALDFLAQYPNLLGVDLRALRAIGQERTRNRSIVRFLQFSDATSSALPVLDAHVLVTFDNDYQIISVTNATVVLPAFSLGQLSRTQAIAIATRVASDAPDSNRLGAPRVLDCAQVLVATPFITAHAWVLQVEQGDRTQRYTLTIDAVDGKILSKLLLVVH